MRKTRIILSLTTIFLAVFALVSSVFAASSASLSITSNVSFETSIMAIKIEARITGAYDEDGQEIVLSGADGDGWVEIYDYLDGGADISWDISSILLYLNPNYIYDDVMEKDVIEPLVYEFRITNYSTDYAVNVNIFETDSLGESIEDDESVLHTYTTVTSETNKTAVAVTDTPTTTEVNRAYTLRSMREPFEKSIFIKVAITVA